MAGRRVLAARGLDSVAPLAARPGKRESRAALGRSRPSSRGQPQAPRGAAASTARASSPRGRRAPWRKPARYGRACPRLRRHKKPRPRRRRSRPSRERSGSRGSWLPSPTGETLGVRVRPRNRCRALGAGPHPAGFARHLLPEGEGRAINHPLRRAALRISQDELVRGEDAHWLTTAASSVASLAKAAANRACVYSFCGARKTAAASPLSTTLPRRITMISLASARTTLRS